MLKDDKLAKIKAAMFNLSPVSLTPKEVQLKEQLQMCFAYWVEKFYLTDEQVREWIAREICGGDKRKATYLLGVTKSFLSNVPRATKIWTRYQSIQMLLKAYQIAVDDNDATAIERIADKLAKYADQDKDEEGIDWEALVAIPDWDFTGDVSVIGLQPIENLQAEIMRLREKYGLQLPGTYVEYEDLDGTT